jgi:hypothetical protein
MKITPYPENWIAQKPRTLADLPRDAATPIYLNENWPGSGKRPGAPIGLVMAVSAQDLSNKILTNRFAIAAQPFANSVFADEINAGSLDLILSTEDFKAYLQQPYATDKVGGFLSVFASAGDVWNAWQAEDSLEKILASTSLAADVIALAADAAAPAALPYIHGAHILLNIGTGLIKIGVTVQKKTP